MTAYFILKFLHILGAVVLLGAGGGITLMLLLAHRSRDVTVIAATANAAVAADALFMTSAMILQPFTGGFLMVMTSATTGDRWIVVSLALYALAGLLWLPVMFIQIDMRRMARRAVQDHAPLPARYHVLARRRLICGVPSYGAMLAILWLMIAKP